MARTAQRDHYDILGVPRDAAEQDIREAFRTLALRHHPALSPAPDAVERFRRIAEAYAVLSDPRRRAAYDAGEPVTAAVRAFPEIDAVLADLGLLPSGGGREPARGADVETALTVPLRRVLDGGPEPVTIRRPGRCGDCDGSGARPGTRPRPCPACEGSGQRVAARRQRGVTLREISTCAPCGGQGVVVEERCPHCGGLGEVERRDTVTVRIPPGIDEGVTVRVPGYGAPSPEAGGPPGDAYVVVRTAADSRFARRGPDLWCHEEVPVTDAVLGTTRTVPCLDGDAPLTVPPGTQPGTVLRVAGRGLPRWGGPGRGDLRVSVAVRVPDRLGERERRLYEQLREAGPAR